ncbi:MAG: DUF2622 domain-containing protein [Taibaiella sp.]|nr:DUF2622 domain-containing protein [Taibaiella sp.]
MVNRFTTRVELHHASNVGDYNKLHLEMETEGFSRTITWENDINTYHLPTAEYNKFGESLTGMQVLESAKKAATKTGKTFSVLVTKSAERLAFNLPIVK